MSVWAQISRCLKSKYPLFFSARWVSRYAGMDVSLSGISTALRCTELDEKDYDQYVAVYSKRQLLLPPNTSAVASPTSTDQSCCLSNSLVENGCGNERGEATSNFKALLEIANQNYWVESGAHQTSSTVPPVHGSNQSPALLTEEFNPLTYDALFDVA
jgi:hypothetical protein